ncbi:MULTISPECIES: threonine aldolase family protein [Marinobacter]|uniref:L-threonine aldolase n=1 Tax=Marinobacter suaedae TaxID=3057675 RepID=A0ABT8VX82_9GAMM|nr:MULTISPECIES: low specificity L-threonine aldolase [unclassified Marinobacter]MBZ2168716.1 low specificity L-threonine aldolase [Marinobacter sp. F4216]MDO3720594.1 low specificity L-threonine aldolase [Marinobacter sp. chi1]
MSQFEQFASDNYSGVCPQAWKAMEAANAKPEPAYGEDSWTLRAADSLRALFDTDCEVYFVFNGTAANSLSLASIGQSFHSVICHELAHIETDECGGPEFASNGSKLLLGQGPEGKLTPESIEHLVTKRTDIHYPKPKALSLTQATEVGTIYTPEELKVIKSVADKHRLNIHMDGARFANAVAALDVHPADITWKAGVDVLCFSGTKNGLAMGEAVVFFNRSLAEDFEWRCKQAGQLASKMRYISAPWCGLLENDTWLDNARHANACAARLANGLKDIPGVAFRYPRQANGLFVEMPEPVQEALRARGWRFYNFIGGAARLMCSWATTHERVDQFIADVRELMEQFPADQILHTA